MWKKILGLGLAFFLLALPAMAIDIQEEGTSLGEITHINVVGSAITATRTGGDTATITMDDTDSNLEFIQFTPGDFTVTSTDEELTAATAPGLEYINYTTAIVWDDAQTTPVQVTLKVPSNYSSGGAFRALCDSDATTTPSQVDFSLFINTDGSSTWDATASNQTPVALARVFSSPELVTLTPDATDAASILANSWLTVNVWRDDVADGTDNLELYWLEFYYTAVRNN